MSNPFEEIQVCLLDEDIENKHIYKIWDIDEVGVADSYLDKHFALPNRFGRQLATAPKHMSERVKTITGRVRVLATMPAKPAPLVNIRYSIAWCSPLDKPKFSKNKANEILVGRWITAFDEGYELRRHVRNTGTIEKLDTLSDLMSAIVLDQVRNKILPWWVKASSLVTVK